MWNERRDAQARASQVNYRKIFLPVLVLTSMIPFLQGCPAAVVTAGVAGGASIAHERRSAQMVLDDQNIQFQALQILSDNPHSIKQYSQIGVTSYNLVVLLVGQTKTQSISNRYAELVSRLPKVRRVVNEVTIGPFASFTRQSEDTLITSRVKLALTEIKIPGFDLTRVKVVTEAGTVFLMGLVHPNEEDAAVEKARNVAGVKKVVKIFEQIAPEPSP